jgi:DNA-binding transcriptional MerR regulator
MLQFIRHAERLGFSLKDIRQVLRVWRRNGITCGIVRQIAQQKLERVDALLTGGRSLAGTDGAAGTAAAVDRGIG